MNINEWLDQSPKPEEIATNPDGSQYIPIGIVEQLLDDMTGKDWGTSNFKCTISETFEHTLVHASVELTFANDLGAYRVMAGSKTFNINDYPDNQDWAAIALSECIKNAAKKLGRRFGRELNGRVDKPVIKKEGVLPKPDEKIMQKYLAALTAGDEATIKKLVSMYDIKIG